MDSADTPRKSANENDGSATNGELDINRITDALNEHFKARINIVALFTCQAVASISTIVFDYAGTFLSQTGFFTFFVVCTALWLIPTLYFAYRIASLGALAFSFQPFYSKFLSKSIDIDKKLKDVLRDASLRSATISNDIKNNISTSRSMRKLVSIFISATIVIVGIAQRTAPSALSIQGHLVQWHAGKILTGQFSGSANTLAQTPFVESLYLLMLIALSCLLSQSILIDAVYAHAQKVMRAPH